jgi:hypothetical protein
MRALASDDAAMPTPREQICVCCGDGVCVGLVPFGALKGRPACDACLRAIHECGPGIEDEAERTTDAVDDDRWLLANGWT